MNIWLVLVIVKNCAKPKQAASHEFLVDSGALYSVMPTKDLKALGIKPNSSEEFILANGEKIKKQVGNALFEFQGKVRAAPIIFGDEGIYLLGATTLESLGLIIDPINRQLKALPMVLMGARSQGGKG